MKRWYIMTLSALLALPVSSANADALLFPYVVTSPTVASIISVVNKDASGRLFIEYFNKIDLDHDSECTSSGRREIGSARNDMVSFEANGAFVGSNPASTNGGPLFNDPASNVTYAGDDFTMNQTGPNRAYLIVDDNDTGGEDLYGEAMIMETTGGAAWGYIAYNAADDDRISPAFDVSSPENVGVINDVHGEALDGENNTDGAPMTLLPGDEWNTLLLVTPLEDDDQRLCADCSVEVEINRTGVGNDSDRGLYDRDTNPLTGSEELDVVCVSGVNMNDMMPATLQAIFDQQGGWGFVDMDTGTTTTKQGTTSRNGSAAVVMKLEFNKVQFISPSTSNSFTGTVNSAVWLLNHSNAQGNDAF